MISRQTFWIAGCIILMTTSIFAWSPFQEKQEAKPGTKTEDPLATRQKQIADQIQRLEALLLRSADIEAIDNPTRAALLQQAAQLSKQTDLNALLENASKNLRSNQLSDAIDQQKASRDAMSKLLELLQSENREKRVREQRDQVRRWIEDADRLLRMQSSLRGRTEGGQDLSKAAEDQSRLSDKAEQISKDLGGDESKEKPTSSDSKSKPSQKPDGSQPDSAKPDSAKPDGKSDQSSKPSDGENKDSQSDSNKSDSNKSDSNKSDSNKSDSNKSDSNKSDSNKSDSNKSDSNKSDSNKSENQSGEKGENGKPNDDSNQSDSNSQQGKNSQQENQQPEAKSPTERAQQQIQKAQDRMKEAQQQLKDAKRQGAVEKQREAEENLKQAIQQLEEILKQLREEEVKRSLETLSTRIRRMLEMQSKVNEESQRLHEIAGENPDRQILAKATTLARDQLKVAQEGERALLLLKEEGSSAAFPEALQQVNRDANAVSTRLDAGDVGKVTLLIQADILQALEEMVEALAKIKKENDEKKQQQQQRQQQGGQGQMDTEQQPLINKLAELRLIRTLQLRVNKRTTTLSQMLDNPTDAVGQAKAKDLMEQLQDLSKRQDNIESVTRKVASEN